MRADPSPSPRASAASAAAARSERARALLDYLESAREELCWLLERMVAAESPSDVPETQLAVQAILTEELESLGFRVRKVAGRESGGYLLAAPRRRSRGRPLQALIGHSDTVWPVGTIDTMPIVNDGRKMTGPGICDMKGGLVMIVYALKALAATGIGPEVTPVVLVNSDEETGSLESDAGVRRLARIADRVLVLEGAQGRRGRLKTARKSVGEFTVKIRGKAAHAGLAPGEGVSAILELANVVQRLHGLNDPAEGITVNVGTIAGGLRSNVVAPESRAEVDVRVVTQEQARRIEAQILGLKPETPGTELEIVGSLRKPPLERTPRNRALWRLARDLGRELGFELKQTLAGGGSDGNTASLYTATLDGLGAVGGGAHAAHEHILLEPLPERCALLALLIAAPALGLGQG